MASRKKDPAALRTLSIFTRRTPLEEVADELEADADDLAESVAAGRAAKNPLAMEEHAEDAAIRWLGLDVFHEGDDIKVAVHPKGHAVLVLVRKTVVGSPYSTATIKLSRAQWSKLKQLAREDGKA